MVGIVPVLENWRDPNSLTAQSLDVGQLAGQSHKVATVPGPKKKSVQTFLLHCFPKYL